MRHLLLQRGGVLALRPELLEAVDLGGEGGRAEGRKGTHPGGTWGVGTRGRGL